MFLLLEIGSISDLKGSSFYTDSSNIYLKCFLWYITNSRKLSLASVHPPINSLYEYI